MCGIAAIVGNNKQNSEDLKAMLLPISHRGEKQYFNESLNLETCVLGMNRLAIVDRERAKQPIESNNGEYYIIFNGEIYNYKDLQRKLEEKGYKFHTNSDTEVLVNGYQEWGENVLNKVSGMFAFFIYNKKNHSYFVARDPLGVKPLYWAEDKENNHYFASEIKSLVGLHQVETINLFPPAHFMKDGKIEKYFNLPTKINDDITEQEATEKVRELFDHSVKIRVQTDLPVAVYLSGGIDSTAVLATAMKYHNNVTAVIVGRDQSTDKEVAIKYCTENNIKYIVGVPPTEKELSKGLDEIVKITESFEPNMIRQSAISYHIAKTASENGFKVILCGEGSDEIFAGYPEFTKLTSSEEIQKKIAQFLADLHRTQLQRVDRTSMVFTTEVREPFLDKDLLQYVLQIPTELKIKEVDNKIVTKYILRKAMSDRLPEYIFNRDKVVLSEGAGFGGNQKIGGLFYDMLSKEISDEEFEKVKSEYKEWNLETKEEVYYFKSYVKFGYLKAEFNQNRTTVNKIDTQQEDTKLAQKVLDSFNTWKFKKEQPNTEEKLIESILQNIRKKQPIKFVMYWGKGDREYVSDIDLMAIERLLDFKSFIKKEYPKGVELTFIFTDNHAKLNGYSSEGATAYFNSVRKEVEKHGIKNILLSELVEYNEDKISKDADNVLINDDLLNNLVKSSERHYKHPENNYLVGAKIYYLQNQFERKAVEQKFGDNIFLTYNGNEVDGILPTKLPVFYMYSYRKGFSEKPWFM
jgi:asparagine synthase (glutamine-hydrolysing)